MTVDTTTVNPPHPRRSDLRPPAGVPPYTTENASTGDPEAVFALARAQLLAYQALAYGSIQDLRIVPIARNPYPRARVRQGHLLPLERHERTRALRYRFLQDEPEPDEVVSRSANAVDFVAARIPGTGVHIGLSHRLFAICAALHQVYAEWPDPTRSSVPGVGRTGLGEDGPGREALGQATRNAFTAWENEHRASIGELLRERYLHGARLAWSDLLPGRQLHVALEDPQEGDLLEAVAGDTYLAIGRNDPILLNATR